MGLRLLSTRDGLYTNALFGFLNILQKLTNDEQPDALCVAFDRKAPHLPPPGLRGYKAKRHAMPEELAMQMPVLKEILAAMRIPTYELDGWEADDLLAPSPVPASRRAGIASSSPATGIPFSWSPTTPP